MIFQEITSTVLAKAIEVHSVLGPGLLESAYKECLIYELQQAGLQVKKEVPVPLIYKDVHLDHGYRMDILVEEKFVIEIKVAE
jgi:GxxExxY protein